MSEFRGLAKGGYGAIKEVMAFNRLTKMPMQMSRFIRAEGIIAKNIENSIWTSTKRHNSVENAFKHWKDHGCEFSTLQNSKQYVEATRNFVNNPPPGTLIKIRTKGDVIIYNPSTNSFVISNIEGLPRTMYKPRCLDRHSYSTNLEYFNAQK